MTHTIKHEYFGMMPNQNVGELNGRPYYYRARHGSWKIYLGPAGTEADLDVYAADPNEWDIVASGDHEHAGWMENEEARAFLEARLTELDQ